MDPRDASPQGNAPTVDDRRPGNTAPAIGEVVATGSGEPAGEPGSGREDPAATPSRDDTMAAGGTRDLSAMPGSEEGSLAALLGGVARAPSALPPIELAAGTDLGGTYRIVRRIGSGGMGVVYLARDLELQREVAVKVHRAAVGTERLYREAVAMAQLAHPNVVTVHGVGRIDGRLFVAMEYVPGNNLVDWLALSPRSWREIVDVVLAAGEGLAAAHDAGFVHRDIKPHNILVGRDRRPRIGDFGLVCVTSDGSHPSSTGERALSDATLASRDPGGDDARDATSTRPGRPAPRDSRSSGSTPAHDPTISPLASDLTADGATLGTPAYMAPEQLAGADVDARADQFALAVVLYEALYGRRPWRGGSLAELRVEVSKVPPAEPPRGAVPAWIWPVLRKGMAAAPTERHVDVRAMLTALRTPPRRRVMVAAGGGVGLAAVAVTAGLMLPARRAPVVSCDAAGAVIAPIWGPVARSTIAANFARLDGRDGPDRADQLARALDDWALRWQQAAVASCQATRADHTWSAATAEASARCLRTSLDAFRDFVAHAGTDKVVVTDVSALPAVDGCGDPRQLVGEGPSTLAGPGASVDGYWSGDFGRLVLRRVGDEVLGVYDHDDGAVRGAMVGDTFVGWWCEAPSRRPSGDAGDVEMRFLVDKDGVRAIAGRWRYGAEGQWDDRWDLTWDGGAPPPTLVARLDDPSLFCQRP